MELMTWVIVGVLLLFVLFLFWERKRIQEISFQLSDPPGFSVKLRDAVRKEVNRTLEKALHTMVDLDLELIPLWERESLHQGEDRIKRLQIVEEKVKRLETELLEAPPEEKVHCAWTLRELYWQWLKQGRDVHPSSQPYQNIRREVEDRLQRIKATITASK